MNVALIGYGKMGRQVAKLLIPRGHRLAMIIDEDNIHELTADNLRDKKVDVAIEFTTPEISYTNIMTCLAADVAVVSGTTGWNDKIAEVAEYCRKRNGALCHSPNFSIAVNIMLKLNETLAQMMNSFGEYDVTLEEVHHTRKIDAPSGTAVALADGILRGLDRKEKWVGHTTVESEELEVLSVRRSTVQGIHTITYESDADRIVLMHEAKDRKAFAEGAIIAAEFIQRKKGVFSMMDVLGF